MKTTDAWSWPDHARIERHDVGLINQTFTVAVDDALVAILQRLNTDIFVPEVHEDIEAITQTLADAGLPTTRLIRTADDRLWHTEADGSVWRALTPIGDRTIEKIRDPSDARSAGALVARFHAALQTFRWDFRSVRPGAHDTDATWIGSRGPSTRTARTASGGTPPPWRRPSPRAGAHSRCRKVSPHGSSTVT